MKALGLLPKDWQPRKRSDGRTPKKENQPRRGPQACQTGAHPKRHRHLCGLWSSDDQQAFWIDLPTRSVPIHNLSARAHTAKGDIAECHLLIVARSNGCGSCDEVNV